MPVVYRRILIAVDLSMDSSAVGQRAQALAGALKAELSIIHVVEPLAASAPIPPDVPPDFTSATVVQTQAELVEIAREHIGALASELGVPVRRWRVVVGHTKDEIVHAAADGRMDLIVIGNRGRHAFAFLVKPTEDAVLKRAPCDVLAVRLVAPEDSKPKRK